MAMANMTTKNCKAFFIHISIFIAVHAFGALSILSSLNNLQPSSLLARLPENTLTNINVILPVTTYILLTIIGSSLYIWCHFILTKKIHSTKPFSSTNPLLLHSAWAIISSYALIFLNSLFYPKSDFSIPLQLPSDAQYFTSSTSVLICLAPLVLLLRPRFLKLYALIGIVAILTMPPNHYDSTFINSKKKNVIIIGVDSLRPELVSTHMPFLQSQLDTSTVFRNAYTPLARTFPAWMSIITGRHPVSHGARFNLIPEQFISKDNLYLPAILGQNGYHTIYASDERRFSQLGKKQGFDEVIGPSSRASEFILGSFADFPITNLLLALDSYNIIFPDLYSNRAAHILYYPDRFSNQLKRAIEQRPLKPVFMATHFCLAHWPFTHAKYSKPQHDFPNSPDYAAMLGDIDKQIQSLIQILKKEHILENSIIVFLSDHGESWGNLETHLTNAEGAKLTVTDYGHGQTAYSPLSQSVLISIRDSSIPTGIYEADSSLSDITPTILSLLDTHYDKSQVDGKSLTSLPLNSERALPFESGVYISGIDLSNPSTINAATEGAKHYNITSAGKVRLKDSSVHAMIPLKEIGIKYGNQSIYLTRNSDNPWLVINHHTNTFSRINKLALAPQKPAKALCRFFHRDSEFIKTECETALGATSN